MRRIRKVNIIVSESFYRDLDSERNRVKTNLGLNKISFPDFTEMISRSGVKIKLGIKNGKKKKQIKII